MRLLRQLDMAGVCASRPRGEKFLGNTRTYLSNKEGFVEYETLRVMFTALALWYRPGWTWERSNIVWNSLSPVDTSGDPSDLVLRLCDLTTCSLTYPQIQTFITPFLKYQTSISSLSSHFCSTKLPNITITSPVTKSCISPLQRLLV